MRPWNSSAVIGRTRSWTGFSLSNAAGSLGSSCDSCAASVGSTEILEASAPVCKPVLSKARRGQLTGSVDDAARAVITAAGYGTDYKLFTHRVGHGIGLDGHEHPYLVRSSKTLLEPGMTFSNEPGIYVRDEFGLRLEDDMVIAEDGPARLLTPGSPSLEQPIA